MKIKIIIGFVAVVALGAMSFAVGSLKSTDSWVDSASAGVLEAQTNSGAGVEVKIVPNGLFSAEWNFDVTLDTHAGSLDQDLLSFAILRTDDGRSAVPLRWEGDLAGGHHRSGTIVFRAFEPKPQIITMQISGFGESDLVYSWRLAP